MTVCEPSEPRYARRKPVSNPGEHPPEPPNLGSVAGRTPEFLDKFPPAGRLGFFISARDEHPQMPFAEGVNIKRGGRPQEAGLNLSGQLQKVHDLGDTRPRNALHHRAAGGLPERWRESIERSGLFWSAELNGRFNSSPSHRLQPQQLAPSPPPRSQIGSQSTIDSERVLFEPL